ncbi:phage portal protein, partial [Haemophilus influenzae]|nr:phage portal protein [Haemophilus influenzae]
NPAEVKRRRRVEVEENRKFGLKFDTDLTNTGTTNDKTKNDSVAGGDGNERNKDE